jgi:hypothetical protein
MYLNTARTVTRPKTTSSILSRSSQLTRGKKYKSWRKLCIVYIRAELLTTQPLKWKIVSQGDYFIFLKCRKKAKRFNWAKAGLSLRNLMVIPRRLVKPLSNFTTHQRSFGSWITCTMRLNLLKDLYTSQRKVFEVKSKIWKNNANLGEVFHAFQNS